ncbi:MAG: prenyltransferase [Armatimonadetes bacterium]|nr:prenyltransferase [Armatimonadota bacterium]
MLAILAASRPQFLTASVMPVLVAGAWVRWHKGTVDAGLWFLTLLGMIALHLGANLLNDYFDHLSRADELNLSFVRPFTGGSRAIQEGLLTPAQVLYGGLVATAVGSAVGLYLTARCGGLVFLLGAIGVLTYFFYTAPPVAFSYRGLGELIVGLDFGLLPMLGTEYVLSGAVTPEMAVVALPLAAFVANILLINEFPDAEADALAGKRQLVVLLGPRRAVSLVVGLYSLALVVVAFSVAAGFLPAAALWSMLAAIPAGVASQSLADGPDDPQAWRIACPAGVIAHILLGLTLFVALIASSPASTGLSA